MYHIPKLGHIVLVEGQAEFHAADVTIHERAQHAEGRIRLSDDRRYQIEILGVRWEYESQEEKGVVEVATICRVKQDVVLVD